MTLPHFLVLALAFTAKIKYPLIFVGAFIEGPILMIASGFLLHNGVLALVPLFIALVLGDLVGDVVWYCLGRYVAEPVIRRKGKFFGVSEEKFEKGKALFHKYHENILIVSKLTLGFGLAVVVLMVAGATKVSFKKYMLINVCGELVLVALLLSIGYFFGNAYGAIDDRYKAYFIIGIVAAIGIVLYVVTHVLRKVFWKV